MPLSRLAIDASRAVGARPSGTERYSIEVIRALAALPGRPSLTLYVRRGQDTTLLPADARHRVVGIPRLWTHIGLSIAISRDHPDALFVPSHVVPGLHPRATVVTIHDLGYLVEPEAHTRRGRTMLDLSTRWSARLSRRIIAISSQTKQDLVDRYRVSDAKVTVVPSGVSTDLFHPLIPADVDRHLSAAGIERPYVLFLSTVQPRKNVARLVDAFESLDDTNLRLVIAGRKGWLADDIEQRIRASPSATRISRLMDVDDDLAVALYCGAECFVLPSLYEGFGMGVLEAMACGCPVVTSNLSSLPEVAGDAGVLVDPMDPRSIRDGIETALVAANRRRLVARGYQRAAERSWNRTAQSTLAVIRDAVG